MPIYDRNKLQQHAIRSAANALQDAMYNAEGFGPSALPDAGDIVYFSLMHVDGYMKAFDKSYDALDSMGSDADHSLVESHNAALRAVGGTFRILDKGAPDVVLNKPWRSESGAAAFNPFA